MGDGEASMSNGDDPVEASRPRGRSSAPSVVDTDAATHLLNLLAVIHGDGGHHTDRVGLKQSVADAHVKWAALIRAADNTLHPKLQKMVDSIKGDYLDPEYPRDLLVTEVTDLRARVATLEAAQAPEEDDGPGEMLCKKHDVVGCEECWTAEELAEDYDDV